MKKIIRIFSGTIKRPERSGLDTFDRMKVIRIVVFDWVFEMAEKSTERVRRWREMNQERMRELSRKSSAAYWDRNKDDPEFREKRREQNRENMRRAYAKKRAEMTPEELEEERRKVRERVAKSRAIKKATKLAEQQAAAAAAAAESKPEE